jgi:enamine deaminase RidA (YjgF/YER057c/UK114 family)|tara:strand:- start:94 stop:576 length:483 start_codon:yes stop_codon:yes gene_type:complete
MTADERIRELDLILPEPIKLPPNLEMQFSWVRVSGNRVFISGHIALNVDGSVSEVTGKVGGQVTVEQGYEAARQTGLAILSSLKRELGTLNKITAWLRVFGMVNVEPGFVKTPSVINGFSDLILDVFGKEIGDHSRSAVGMAELPFGAPVEIEAEVEIST